MPLQSRIPSFEGWHRGLVSGSVAGRLKSPSLLILQSEYHNPLSGRIVRKYREPPIIGLLRRDTTDQKIPRAESRQRMARFLGVTLQSFVCGTRPYATASPGERQRVSDLVRGRSEAGRVRRSGSRCGLSEVRRAGSQPASDLPSMKFYQVRGGGPRRRKTNAANNLRTVFINRQKWQ